MMVSDTELLAEIRQMAADAPDYGLCAMPFILLHKRFTQLIDERDELYRQAHPTPQKPPETLQKGEETPDVLMFIGRFSHDHKKPRKEVYRAFLEGGCWWFAYILKTRFEREYPCEIVIDYVAGHFACRINGTEYDITGECGDSYTWERWDDCADELQKERITQYCINF